MIQKTSSLRSSSTILCTKIENMAKIIALFFKNAVSYIVSASKKLLISVNNFRISENFMQKKERKTSIFCEEF